MPGRADTTKSCFDIIDGSARQATLPYRELGRAHFLRMLFRILDEEAIRYCVLHSYEGLPEELPSDLDLAIHPQDAPKLPSIFQNLQNQGYRPVQCLNYAVGGFYFVFMWFEGLVVKSLAIDIINEHRRGGLILMSGEALVAGRRKRGDFWIPDPATEFAYLLAKKTLKGSVRGPQEERLKLLAVELGPLEAERVAGNLFGERWKGRIVEACRKGCAGGLLKKLRRKLWWTIVARDPLDTVRYVLADAIRLIRRWFQPTGLFVVVLGPDGVGKSTLIKHLTQAVSQAFRRQRMFHWRPGLVWRRSGTGPVTAPHSQPPHPAWWSVARLFAHLVDYSFGYWLIIRPFLARSGLVVFDRYWYDLLVDPRRFRYGGPLWLVRALRPFIPKPDRVLVLDAPEEVVLFRKREVGSAELQRQRQCYLDLVRKLSNARVIDTAQIPEAVVATAATAILEHLAQRNSIGTGRHAGQPALVRYSGHELYGSIIQALTGTNADIQSASAVLLTSPKQAPVAGYRPAFDFLVVPGKWSAPRLLPLEPRACSASGTKLINSMTLKGRAAKTILSIGLRTGIAQCVLQNRVRVLVRSNVPDGELKDLLLQEALKNILGRHDIVIAVSLGTPGAYRKVTAQIMDLSGRILAYAKLADSSGSMRALNHERANLERLAAFTELEGNLPRVMTTFHLGKAQVLVTTAGPPRPGPRVFRSCHRDFLRSLFAATQEQTSFQDSPMWASISGMYTQLQERLTRQWLGRLTWALELLQTRLAQNNVSLGLAHRDFTPWNTRQHRNGSLFVVDWEATAWGYLPMYDVFHFGLMLSTLAKGSISAWEKHERGWGKIATSVYSLSDRNLAAMYVAYTTDMSLFYLAARLEAPSEGDDRVVNVLGRELDHMRGVCQQTD